MKQFLKPFIALLTLLFSTTLAFASLQPGELAIKGTVKEFNKKDGTITFLVGKNKKEFTFKYQDKKKFRIKYNGKKISESRYMSKQDEMYHERLVIFKPVKEWKTDDRKTLNNFVARYLGAVDKEYYDERN